MSLRLHTKVSVITKPYIAFLLNQHEPQSLVTWYCAQLALRSNVPSPGLFSRHGAIHAGLPWWAFLLPVFPRGHSPSRDLQCFLLYPDFQRDCFPWLLHFKFYPPRHSLSPWPGIIFFLDVTLSPALSCIDLSCTLLSPPQGRSSLTLRFSLPLEPCLLLSSYLINAQWNEWMAFFIFISNSH